MSRWSDLHLQKRSCGDVTMQEHAEINMVARFSESETSKMTVKMISRKRFMTWRHLLNEDSCEQYLFSTPPEQNHYICGISMTWGSDKCNLALQAGVTLQNIRYEHRWVVTTYIYSLTFTWVHFFRDSVLLSLIYNSFYFYLSTFGKKKHILLLRYIALYYLILLFLSQKFYGSLFYHRLLQKP